MSPPRSGRPHLVPPELAERVPAIRSATTGALVIGALLAVSIVVQAVALATAIDRSILHHSALTSVLPALITVALAVVARAVLTLVGEHLARRAAPSRSSPHYGEQLLRQVLCPRARLARRGTPR